MCQRSSAILSPYETGKKTEKKRRQYQGGRLLGERRVGGGLVGGTEIHASAK